MSDKPPIDPAVSTSSDENAATVVSADMPCLTCEYNLRSLSIEGRCPECGQPVRDTLDRRKLFSHVEILSNLAGFAVTMTVSLFVITFALAGCFLSPIILRGSDWSLGLSIMATMLVPLYLIAAMGTVVYIVHITKRHAFRRILVAAYIFIVAVGLNLWSSKPDLALLIASLFISSPVLMAVGIPAWFAQHVNHLAALAGNAKLKLLANITAKISLTLPVLVLIYIGGLAIGSVVSTTFSMRSQLSNGYVKSAVLLILLVISIFSALLGFQLVATIKKIRNIAESLKYESQDTQ